MKKVRLILATTLTVLLCFTGCDKDIRGKYVGDWEFVTEIDSNQFDYDLYKWILLGFDTISYSGKIIYGEHNDELIIQYTEQNEVTAWVNHNGNLWTSVYRTSTRSRHGYFEETNKMYLTLSYSKYGGFLTDHYIIGTKK